MAFHLCQHYLVLCTAQSQVYLVLAAKAKNRKVMRMAAGEKPGVVADSLAYESLSNMLGSIGSHCSIASSLGKRQKRNSPLLRGAMVVVVQRQQVVVLGVIRERGPQHAVIHPETQTNKIPSHVG